MIVSTQRRADKTELSYRRVLVVSASRRSIRNDSIGSVPHIVCWTDLFVCLARFQSSQDIGQKPAANVTKTCTTPLKRSCGRGDCVRSVARLRHVWKCPDTSIFHPRCNSPLHSPAFVQSLQTADIDHLCTRVYVPDRLDPSIMTILLRRFLRQSEPRLYYESRLVGTIHRTLPLVPSHGHHLCLQH